MEIGNLLDAMDYSNWKNRILNIAHSLKDDNCETRENLSDKLIEIAKDITDVEYGIFFKKSN